MKASQLLEELPNLEPGELKKLIARAQFLANPQGAPSVNESDEEMVWAEAYEVLRKAGAVVPRNVRVLFKIPNAGPVFRTNCGVLMAFIRGHFQPKTQLETVKAVRMVLNFILLDLRGRGAALKPYTLCRGMGYVERVVDRAFPGYLASGLLPFVLRQNKQVTSK